MDSTYKKFVKRWEEVTELPTQSVGPATPIYKWLVRHLKVMPWPAVVLASLMFVVFLYVLLGAAITIIASFLQKGV
jgi:hypothetical protein